MRDSLAPDDFCTFAVAAVFGYDTTLVLSDSVKVDLLLPKDLRLLIAYHPYDTNKLRHIEP